MLLDTYLTSNAITTTEFAQRIGRHRTFVKRVRSGQHGVSPDTMQKIIEVTGGQVTASDIHLARVEFMRRQKQSIAAAE
jgi:hypothetical protein